MCTQPSGTQTRLACGRGARRFMAARSLATAARTGVMMDPGPMAFTRMLCGASESAMHLPREHTYNWRTEQARESSTSACGSCPSSPHSVKLAHGA